MLRADESIRPGQISKFLIGSHPTRGGAQLSPPSQGHRGPITAACTQPSSSISMASVLRGCEVTQRRKGELHPSGRQPAAQQDLPGQ